MWLAGIVVFSGGVCALRYQKIKDWYKILVLNLLFEITASDEKIWDDLHLFSTSKITLQLVLSLYEIFEFSHKNCFKGNNSLTVHWTCTTKLIKDYLYINFHACGISRFVGDLLTRLFHSKFNNSIKGQVHWVHFKHLSRCRIWWSSKFCNTYHGIIFFWRKEKNHTQEAHGPHHSPEKPWPIQKYFSNIHLPHLTLGAHDFNQLAFIPSWRSFMQDSAFLAS
jgi:hypothetical protein